MRWMKYDDKYDVFRDIHFSFRLKRRFPRSAVFRLRTFLHEDHCATFRRDQCAISHVERELDDGNIVVAACHDPHVSGMSAEIAFRTSRPSPGIVRVGKAVRIRQNFALFLGGETRSHIPRTVEFGRNGQAFDQSGMFPHHPTEACPVRQRCEGFGFHRNNASHRRMDWPSRDSSYHSR